MGRREGAHLPEPRGPARHRRRLTHRRLGGRIHRGWTLASHFDGNTWSKVNTPNPATSGNDLDGVAAVASDDVWAVGERIDDEDPGRNLILHFDGTAWTAVASPDPGVPNRLYGVDAATPTDLWSVGEARLAAVPSTQALRGCAPPPPPTP